MRLATAEELLADLKDQETELEKWRRRALQAEKSNRLLAADLRGLTGRR